MLCIIVHPSIRVALGIIFLTDTSTFNAFFRSVFDVGYLFSSVSWNKAVGIGASSHWKKSIIHRKLFQYYTPPQSFFFAFFGAFIATVSFFLIRNLQVNYFETNSFPFYQLSTHNCMVFGFVVFPIIPVGPSPNFINDFSVTISHHILFQIPCLWDKTWSACKNLSKIFGVNFYTVIR